MPSTTTPVCTPPVPVPVPVPVFEVEPEAEPASAAGEGKCEEVVRRWSCTGAAPAVALPGDGESWTCCY